MSECRVCACFDEDCSGCVERTGEPCSWVDPTLCSACFLALGGPPLTEVELDGMLRLFAGQKEFLNVSVAKALAELVIRRKEQARLERATEEL